MRLRVLALKNPPIKLSTRFGDRDIPPQQMHMETISIRRAVAGDASSIAQLSATLGYDAEPAVIAGRLRAMADSNADLIIVALDSSSDVVGWLQAHASHIIESGFRVEITGLIVFPGQRRHGVGRALVDEAERWAKAVAAEAIVVRSNVQRVESHAFYPALGYSATKTQNVYRKTLTK